MLSIYPEPNLERWKSKTEQEDFLDELGSSSRRLATLSEHLKLEMRPRRVKRLSISDMRGHEYGLTICVYLWVEILRWII